jgi:hypothetical protein
MHIWDGRQCPTLQPPGLDGWMESIRSYDDVESGDYHSITARRPYKFNGGDNCKVISTLHNTSHRFGTERAVVARNTNI